MLDRLEARAPRPTSLTRWVYEAIQEAIVTKDLPPGSSVSEASLAARLGVSKTPVREALLRLRLAGLIEQQGGHGLRVVLPSETLIRNAYGVRETVESGAAGQAAENATAEQRALLVQLAEATCSCASDERADEFRNLDRSFHVTVAVSSSNPILEQMAVDAYLLTCVLRDRDVPDVDDLTRCGREHRAIAEAIVHGHVDEAMASAKVHIVGVRDMVLRAYLQERDGDKTSKKTESVNVVGGPFRGPAASPAGTGAPATWPKDNDTTRER